MSEHDEQLEPTKKAPTTTGTLNLAGSPKPVDKINYGFATNQAKGGGSSPATTASGLTMSIHLLAKDIIDAAKAITPSQTASDGATAGQIAQQAYDTHHHQLMADLGRINADVLHAQIIGRQQPSIVTAIGALASAQLIYAKACKDAKVKLPSGTFDANPILAMIKGIATAVDMDPQGITRHQPIEVTLQDALDKNLQAATTAASLIVTFAKENAVSQRAREHSRGRRAAPAGGTCRSQTVRRRDQVACQGGQRGGSRGPAQTRSTAPTGGRAHRTAGQVMRWLLVILVACNATTEPSLPIGGLPTGDATVDETFERFDIERRGHTTTWDSIFAIKYRQCLDGELTTCRLIGMSGMGEQGNAMTRMMKKFCTEGDRYSCRVLSYLSARTPTANDCEEGLDLSSCVDKWKDDPKQLATLGKLYADSCRHGVVFDCLGGSSANFGSPAAERLAATRSCLYAGSCAHIAGLELRRKDLRNARYFLEAGCQLHRECTVLHAAYEDGILAELYPGRATEVAKLECPDDTACKVQVARWSKHLRAEMQ